MSLLIHSIKGIQVCIYVCSAKYGWFWPNANNVLDSLQAFRCQHFHTLKFARYFCTVSFVLHLKSLLRWWLCPAVKRLGVGSHRGCFYWLLSFTFLSSLSRDKLPEASYFWIAKVSSVQSLSVFTESSDCFQIAHKKKLHKEETVWRVCRKNKLYCHPQPSKSQQNKKKLKAAQEIPKR